MQPIVPPRGMRPVPWSRARPTVLASLLCLAISAFVLHQMVVVGDGALRVRPQDHHTAMVVTTCFGALFGALGLGGLAMVATCGNRVPRYRADHEGLALWSRYGGAEVPWAHVRAVGVSYKITPKLATTALRRREAIALEVFVTDADPATVYPRAAHLVVTEDPPRPDLSRTRLRLVLLGSDLEAQLAADVAPYAADRWLGEFQRQWNPVPGA